MAILHLANLERFDPHASDRGRERRFCCPICGNNKPIDAAHRSLSFNVETGAWRCHRCHAAGGGAEPGRRSPRHERKARAPIRAFALADATEDVESGWRRRLGHTKAVIGTPGEAYLAKRGIPVELAHEARVRYTMDFFGREAVLFPLRDRSGKLVAAQGRYIDGRTPKVRDAGRKSRGCFTTPGAWDADPLLIVEAPIDALSLAACGFPAIAVLGCDLADWLAWECAGRRVIIATDADSAGDAAAREWSLVLTARGASAFRLRPTDGQDWNALLTADASALHRELRGRMATPTEPLADRPISPRPIREAGDPAIEADASRCGVCRRVLEAAALEQVECSFGIWWRCLDRADCAAADARRMTELARVPPSATGSTDPATIVAEWRALGADIRLSCDGDHLHLGEGWCYLPEELRRRIQMNQSAIALHLRREPDSDVAPRFGVAVPLATEHPSGERQRGACFAYRPMAEMERAVGLATLWRCKACPRRHGERHL